MNKEVVRKVFYYLGWAIVVLAPIAFAIEIVTLQDLPKVQPWKWVLLLAGVVLIYAARNRDDVLQHHVV